MHDQISNEFYGEKSLLLRSLMVSLPSSRPDNMFAVCAFPMFADLLSWLCSEQTVVATSSTKAEYVAAASCCGQNALTECPTLYASPIEQFWQTTSLSTTKDGVRGITATIDRKVKIFVSEASIKRHLKLEDSEGLKTLTTAKKFKQLALLGYVITSNSLTFQKGHFSPQWKFFIHTILHCLSSKKTAWEQFSSNIAIAIICLATNRTFNFSNLIFEAMVKNLDRLPRDILGVDIPLFLTMLTTPESSPSRITSSPSLSSQTYPSTSQPPSTSQFNQTTPITEEAAPMPHESPLQSVHSLRRNEGSLSLNELMDLCTLLSKKVESLESELKQTKQTYHAALTKLIKRVKKLEQIIKTSQARRRAKVIISDDEEAEDDPSNQGRSLIKELDLDARISLVPPHAADQGRINDTQISDQPAERRREVSTGSGGVSTTSRLVNIIDISTANKLDSTAGVKAKDKGKATIHESEPPKKIKKRVQVQMSVDEELAKKQLDEREEVAAKVDQAHDIDWSDPAILRYHTLQNRPFSMAEVRKNMCRYLKNQGGYKISHFKGMSYEDIRPIFERVWDQNQAFIPMGSEIEKEVMKRSGFDLQQESSKPVEEEIVQQDDVLAEQVVKESSRTAGGRRKKSLARKRARETLSEESAKKQKLEDATKK
ncbi:hypothetical protein Tco_0843810 [Tanacetum coccineum]